MEAETFAFRCRWGRAVPRRRAHSGRRNADGQMTSVSNAGTPGVPSVTLSYAYDAFGDRTSLSDSLGGVVSYSYDGDLRLASLGLLSNSNGTLTLQAQVTFAYDNASRLTGLTQSSPGGVSLVQTRGYDNADGLTNIQVSNPLTSMRACLQMWFFL